MNIYINLQCIYNFDLRGQLVIPHWSELEELSPESDTIPLHPSGVYILILHIKACGNFFQTLIYLLCLENTVCVVLKASFSDMNPDLCTLKKLNR